MTVFRNEKVCTAVAWNSGNKMGSRTFPIDSG